MQTQPPLRPDGWALDRPLYDLPYLLAWRHYVGLSREALAGLSNVSYSMIRVIERGDTRVRGRLVNRLARALDVSAAVLIAYPPDDERASAAATRAATHCAAWRLQVAGKGAA